VTAYKVAEGTQVHHDGVTYGGGERFEATPGAASMWVAAGWVTEVKASAKRVPSKTVEDKAVKTAN
jgi:hypothetical protein